MSSDDARKAPTIDPARLIAALREIYAGSVVTGRWLEWSKGYSDEAVGHDEAAPDAGYYDRNAPPDGYGRDGWQGEGDAPAEPLIPAEWEAYDGAERDGWLSSVADLAHAALTECGISVEPEPATEADAA